MAKFLLGAAVLFLLFLGIVDAGREKSDKERIVVLEKEVSALNEAVSDLSQDLAGAHAWAGSVNLRLNRLEGRGPVARAAVSPLK